MVGDTTLLKRLYYVFSYFHEFWEITFHCKITARKRFEYQPDYKNCTGNESLTNINIDYSPVRVAINSVNAFAHALHSLQKELCPNRTGLCPEMARFKRPRLLEHLKNVSFWDPSLNITVKFDQNYEVSGMYDIMNYRKEGGTNKFIRVATWDGEVINSKINSTLEFDLKNVKWLKGETNSPASYCSENCSLDQTQEEIPTFDFNCCWKCNTCDKLQIVLNNTCVSGPEGWVPNTDRTGWMKRELVYPKWSDGLSIGLTICSMIALVLTLGVFVMFIVHKDNKLLKASGRELCCVMLVGIGLCFIVPPLFVAKPGRSVCYARNLVTGLALVMCYAPLFMKINRIYRIFTNAKTTTARPALIKPRMQLLITFGLITVQLLFTALWFTAKPVLPQEIYYNEIEELVLECTVNQLGFAVNLSYVMLLMLLCTFYAFKTRHFPKNFNESKYIGITMYITCAVWTVFFSFYLNTTHSAHHMFQVSGAYLLIGLVNLVGLFAQKVFIVYRATELRNEELVMTSRSGQANSTQQPKDKQASSG